MITENLPLILTIAIPSVILLFVTIWILSLRRIVPTNLVHIVQRGKHTVSYGVGKESNVYYEFPKWMPHIGVEVRSLPVSNFDIELVGYSAYDKDRVPFLVDIKAFFHIADTNKAAEKVESFEELKGQLTNVVQGSVRSILAKSPLESIMEDRSIFGDQFTENVKGDLANWGVEPIKSIELMDVRDGKDSHVIEQIMAKRMSAINSESRIEVANNKKAAEQAELTAQQEIAVTKADTERKSGEAQALSQQAIAIAQAEADKKSGIAKAEADAKIAEAEKLTAEKKMEVIKVKEIRQAEIDRDKAVIASEQQKKQTEINAEADKFRVETQAVADLSAKSKEAEGIKLTGEAEASIIKSKGEAEAESLKLKGLAEVAPQTTLAKEIGENVGYQSYLIETKKIDAGQIIGVKQAESMGNALAASDLKLLVNSGDIHSGVNNVLDLFTAKGASSINGLIEGLKQTEAGSGLVSMLENLNTKETKETK